MFEVRWGGVVEIYGTDVAGVKLWSSSTVVENNLPLGLGMRALDSIGEGESMAFVVWC